MSGPIVQAGARPKFWLNTDIAHERPTTAALAWSDEKNGRRCELIRRRLRGSISADEQTELEQLQAEMVQHRNLVAPLPLVQTEALYRQMMQELASSTELACGS